MRTLIQALTYHPKLVSFAMDLLRRLLAKRVWEMPRLWIGVLKCCKDYMPHSCPVLLQLPRPQLLDVLEQQPEIRDKLISYAATHLDAVPQDALSVLGLDEDEDEEAAG